MGAVSIHDQEPAAARVPGIAEELDEDMCELGEWAGWPGLDPAAFGVIPVAEALRRRRRSRV